MKKEYKHIIFDLDHTLWDFTANSNATLSELYEAYLLSEMGFSLERFLSAYQLINEQMWYDYNRGRITKNDIREKRFRMTLSMVGGVVADDVADAINEEYLALCPTKGHLVPYAIDILDFLKDRYELHILTNGFSETQDIKVATSGLAPYFKEIINSETCGYLKPDKAIFDFTLARIAAQCHDCVMIGDDLHADVLGAKNAGLDHIYFNRKGLPHNEVITHEISCLSELKSIF